MKKKDQEWALFWCGLLHPVLFGEIPKRQIQTFLKGLAEEEKLFPDGYHRGAIKIAGLRVR